MKFINIILFHKFHKLLKLYIKIEKSFVKNSLIPAVKITTRLANPFPLVIGYALQF